MVWKWGLQNLDFFESIKVFSYFKNVIQFFKSPLGIWEKYVFFIFRKTALSSIKSSLFMLIYISYPLLILLYLFCINVFQCNFAFNQIFDF